MLQKKILLVLLTKWSNYEIIWKRKIKNIVNIFFLRNYYFCVDKNNTYCTIPPLILEIISPITLVKYESKVQKVK